MSVCSAVKAYTRRHEWLADLLSMLALVVLFGSIWLLIDFHQPLLDWMQANVALRMPMLIVVLGLDVALIFGLLCAGSQRCPQGSDDCFRTFRGRRHGSESLYTAFTNWIHHIENVGKRHR
jgi:hypothetical protein